MDNHSNRFLPQQGILPEDVLDQAAVSVIGVGAIGRQVALQLAAIGVPTMQLIDFDTVEATHVTTQGYLHADAQGSRAKVEATRTAIHGLDPAIPVEAVRDRCRARMSLHAAVFCCVDSISARAAIWRTVRQRALFWADGRMLGEVLRVLAVSDGLSRRAYEQTLFPRRRPNRGVVRPAARFTPPPSRRR